MSVGEPDFGGVRIVLSVVGRSEVKDGEARGGKSGKERGRRSKAVRV